MSVQSRTTEEILGLYDDLASRWWLFDIPSTLLGLNRFRSMFREATGDVLDVACGTGENFKYLTGADSVTAFDLSPEMVARARTRAGRFDVAVGDAQDMPYPDDSFDTVVSALSSCTFPDYVAGFKEMERVTKAGGRILLLEHGRSSVGWIAKHQDGRGVARTMKFGGCRSNRDVGSEMVEAGLDIVSHKSTHLGMIDRFVIEV